MTPEQFASWLQGFMEGAGNKALTAKQQRQVLDKLNMVEFTGPPLRITPNLPNYFPHDFGYPFTQTNAG